MGRLAEAGAIRRFDERDSGAVRAVNGLGARVDGSCKYDKPICGVGRRSRVTRVLLKTARYVVER